MRITTLENHILYCVCSNKGIEVILLYTYYIILKINLKKIKK